ncbi:type I methionyl aminopeptidase [Caldithrix abyssi]|uniref:Methionine aminopeptidase n=1 Tax=Caldithrix abyssi DSM 13497 TaxID=880073 RepID=H1XVY5_CALAY|nr:type I methionyl aminopeptidase [Caldithrix abyssi]APF17674.1 map methionine aminopeptidase, type I [Caldithrix abyssi DSM 13497]EHO41757.1 methionine aminopeptidase, type I [Caldithrix abyssi DSM 13497]
MIFLKSEEQIAAIRKSNEIVAEALAFIEKFIEPGVETRMLDREIENFILKKKARPAFKGLYGFPAASCISVNDVVVHGIPGKYKLRDGDIVGIDIGVELNGYYGDAAYTFMVGNVKDEVRRLCRITQESLYKGIEQARVGNRVGDISAAIQEYVEKHGYSVVREFVGHGVGIKPHEDPQVPNYGRRGSGMKLKHGMVLAIEPMINMGTHNVYVEKDQWTVRTADGKPSAHYEHSVAILKDGPVILSKIKQE